MDARDSSTACDELQSSDGGSLSATPATLAAVSDAGPQTLAKRAMCEHQEEYELEEHQSAKKQRAEQLAVISVPDGSANCAPTSLSAGTECTGSVFLPSWLESPDEGGHELLVEDYGSDSEAHSDMGCASDIADPFSPADSSEETDDPGNDDLLEYEEFVVGCAEGADDYVVLRKGSLPDSEHTARALLYINPGQS